MADVQGGPASGSSQNFLKERGAAGPAWDEIVETHAHSQSRREACQISQTLDSPLPAEAGCGIATQTDMDGNPTAS